MFDKKALTLMKKYYLPHKTENKPSENEIRNAIAAGVLVPNSVMTHDEMVAEIKALSERISLETVAKAFLYSLSSGDTRYRTALSSFVWARSMPEHSSADTERKYGECALCGCSHGLDSTEEIDWNRYGVFRYLPPTQYGNSPYFTCVEYVLNDLREFEKLPEVEPCDDDYYIMNRIFGAVNLMKSHNKDVALVTEIRKQKILNTTGNGIHCLLGTLSICSILEGAEDKGFLHSFTALGGGGSFRDGISFYPLFNWKGRDGINYDAVNEIFGSFCGDKLAPDKAISNDHTASASTVPPAKKSNSKAKLYFTDGVYCIMLTDEERRYLALNDLNPQWETVSSYSVTYSLKKRTVLFYDENTIVKVIYEEYSTNDDGGFRWRSYCEFDTHLPTDNRQMLLPLTSRGRPKPITPTNIMAVMPFGCKVTIYLQEGKSHIYAGNQRNNQEIAIGENDRVKNIMSDDDFHEFMRYYIPTCPDDYFERIAEIRNMEHITISFCAGDIFRCQTDREHYTYGLIIGKTRELEKWDELPAEHSFRHLMTQPIIVRMYDFVTTDKEMTAKKLLEKPLRPPVVCSDNDIIWGTHKIIDHKQLEPEDIQFNIQLARQVVKNKHITPFTAEMFVKSSHQRPQPEMKAPMSLYVEWGFVSFEIPWDNVSEDIRLMLDEGRYFDGGVSLGIDGKYCGKKLSDILKETPKNIIQYNLLLHENRDKFNLVMNFLGLPDDCTFDDFAEKFGGISRQRYIELTNARKNK